MVTLLICASVTHLQPQVNSDSSAGYRPMPKLLGTPAERIRTPSAARWKVAGHWKLASEVRSHGSNHALPVDGQPHLDCVRVCVVAQASY